MRDPGEIALPLLSFSSICRVEVFEGETALRNCDSIRIRPRMDLPERCYGVKIGDLSMEPVLKPGMIAVFFPWESGFTAIENIFAVGLKHDPPLIRKVVKDARSEEGKRGHDRAVGGGGRKSFMTPTPLHIPGSRVSPIAESTHRAYLLRKLGEGADMRTIPAKEVAWIHPLIYIHYL